MYISLFFGVVYHTLVYLAADEGTEYIYLLLCVVTNMPRCYTLVKRHTDDGAFGIALSISALYELIPHTIMVWALLQLKPTQIWWKNEFMLVVILVIGFLISMITPKRRRRKQRRYKERKEVFPGFLGFPHPEPVG